ncbi:MAG: phosphatase PAP2 family protein [Thermoleophilia bacterium]
MTGKPGSPLAACLVAGVVVPGLVFAGLAEDVVEAQPFGWDAPTMLWLHDRGGVLAALVMNALSVLGGVFGIGGVLAVSALVLARRRHIGDAMFLIAAVLGAVLASVLVKEAVGRPRPDLGGNGYPVVGSSFPSGHAAGSAALAVAIVVLTWGGRSRWLVVLATTGIAIGVGASRVWLGVHYPSDVLAGWCMGVAWAVGTLAVRGAATRRPKALNDVGPGS